MQLPYDSAIPLLDIYPNKCRDTYTLMFIAALFMIAKPWNQPRCPAMDECIKKV
jgi:hypothetical protein